VRTGPVTREELDEAALKYLDRFDVTVVGMRRMLQRYLTRARAKERDVSAAAQAVDELVSRYVESGIVSDARFASNMAAGLRRRGASQRGVVQKLRTRGVSGEVAKEALSSVDGESTAEAELKAARELARRRRLGPFRTDASEREAKKQRDLAVLARAGFSFDVARRALGTDWDDGESF
jgi:regulatory protein